jgi:hypothetical protein
VPISPEGRKTLFKSMAAHAARHVFATNSGSRMLYCNAYHDIRDCVTAPELSDNMCIRTVSDITSP